MCAKIVENLVDDASAAGEQRALSPTSTETEVTKNCRETKCLLENQVERQFFENVAVIKGGVGDQPLVNTQEVVKAQVETVN